MPDTRANFRIGFLLISMLILLGLSSSAWSAEPVNVHLTDLAPEGTQWGSARAVDGKTVEEPNKIDVSTWVDNAGWWEKSIKLVKKYAEDFKLSKEEPYRSVRADAFVVGGQPVTGVGLWTKAPSAYYWIEFKIPPGATHFTARLLASDDALGYTRGYRPTGNQQGEFTIVIDGEKKLTQGVQRVNLADGTGDKIADIDLAISADAKVIRFRYDTSGWGDGNNNTELILNQAKFSSEDMKH